MLRDLTVTSTAIILKHVACRFVIVIRMEQHVFSILIHLTGHLGKGIQILDINGRESVLNRALDSSTYPG